MSRKVLLLLLYGHTRILDFAAKKVLLAADLTKVRGLQFCLMRG